jgi:hypothetical protein
MGSISLGNMLIISPWVIEAKDENAKSENPIKR